MRNTFVLLQYLVILLMLVNKNPAVNCLFILVHSAMLTNTTFDLINVLVNVDINLRLINAVEVLFILSSCYVVN